MLEQNAHRLLMTVLGVIVLALIMAALFFVGHNPNDNADEDSTFFNQTTSGIVEQNQNRTPKY